MGVGIDCLDLTETLAEVERMIATRRPHHHVAVNAAKIVAIQKDARLAHIIDSCDLVSADGQSIVWASMLIGRALPERVAGIDLMMELLELGTQRGYRVYLLGAKEEVVRRVAEICKERYPGLCVAGFHSGYFGGAEEVCIVESVRSSASDILLVAMGSPQKEYWISKYLPELGVPFCMGVGGSFDVLAGKVKRAPMWQQRYGLEWLYRLWQEPRRMWRRYLLTNLAFARLLLGELTRRYRGRRA